MQNKEIINKCKEASRLLDSYNIPATITLLDSLAKERQDYKISDELNHLRETYKYMAEYMVSGGVDPSRPNVYNDIIEKLRSIADHIGRDVVSIDSADSYSETFRYQRLAGEHLESLLSKYSSILSELQLAHAAGNEAAEIYKRIEELHSSIFNTVWVSLDERSIVDMATDAVISNRYGDWLPAHIISALTLSLNGYYDRQKLLALIKIYQNDISERLSAKALVGIILSLARHPERSRADKEIASRLSFMEDSLIDYSRIREVIMTLIRTRDTDRISTKMKDEVLPEIMKLQPDILKKFREASPDTSEGSGFEINPEWEEMLEKSGLTEKMRELSDMQSDGADLMMVAFSNLKQFPFFNSVSNWFLPFFPFHSAIASGEKERNIVGKLMEMGKNVCDSDKYSLAIALRKMPEMQKDMMISQFDAQFSQLSEELKEKALQSSAPEFDEEVTKVVRDLYRFFRLYRKKQGFNDPFSSPLAFLDIPYIGDMMADSEIVALVAEFYFSRKYYQEALSLFNLLLEDNAEDPALWEKAGACYQSMKFYEKSLECFTKAELLKTPGTWLIGSLAFVNKKQGNFSKAYEYYCRLLEKDPEKLSLILNAAYCALEAGEINQALKHYYHANYIEPENLKIFRAIAWSEFLNKEFEKSEKYYNKILAISQESSDFLNAGHLYAAKGDLRKALELYKKSSSGNYNEFRNAFLQDISILQGLGLDGNSLHILVDYIGLEK